MRSNDHASCAHVDSIATAPSQLPLKRTELGLRLALTTFQYEPAGRIGKSVHRRDSSAQTMQTSKESRGGIGPMRLCTSNKRSGARAKLGRKLPPPSARPRA